MSTLRTDKLETLDGQNLVNVEALSTINQRTIYVGSIAGLVDISNQEDGEHYDVTGYHTGSAAMSRPLGGGKFVWDATRNKDEHNGGTVIDPTKQFPENWDDKTQVYDWLNIPNQTGQGCYVRLYESSVNIQWFGAKGDGVTDDTLAIQKTLYLNGDGNPLPGDVYPLQADVTVLVPMGTYRITDYIHQPSGARVIGLGKPMSNITRGLVGSTEGSCLIYADFVNNLKSAWIVAGYARQGLGGLSDTDVVDPYLYSGDPDTGTITRTARTEIKGVLFFTDKQVASAVSFNAAYDINIEIGTYGFLHPVIGKKSWIAKVSIYGISAHTGGFFRDVRGLKLEGYSNSFGDISSFPSLADNAPVGWETTIATGYSTYETTGLYLSYCSALSTSSFTSEKWERARLYWSCEGVSESAPYTEDISGSALVNINSTVVVNSPQYYGVGSIVSSGGGGIAATKIVNINSGEIVTGTVQSSASIRVEVEGAAPNIIHPSEPYRPNVAFSFYNKEPLVIYVDPVGGNNSNTGLNINNAVADVDTAILRATYYKASTISVKEGTTAFIQADVILADSDIKIVGEGTGANLNPQESGGFIRRINLVDSKVNLSNLTTVIPASSTTAFECMFSTSGDCTITFRNCSVTATDSTCGIVNSLQNTSSILKFIVNGSSIDAEVIGKNGFNSLGDVMTIYVKSESSVITGTASWESDFTLLS